MLIVEALQTDKGHVWYIAPTQGQARDIMWLTLLELGHPVIESSHVNNMQIRLVNGAQISLKGADRPETMRGVSLKFVVLDEYADMKPAVFEQASSALPYFDGTYADAYTGYTLTQQQWNGTANASTSTATWGLNSSYIDSNYVLDGTTEFASVMDSTTRITVKRGRRDVGDQFSAGTMSFTIQDVSGIFNPFDENSPYWDTAEAKPGLAPLREVKLLRPIKAYRVELLRSLCPQHETQCL